MSRKKASGIQRIGENRYRVRVDVLDPKTGKRIDVKKVVDAVSTTDAARKRENLRAEIASGEAKKETVRRRFGDAATSWLEAQLPALKKSTADLYADVLDLHIVPFLGRQRAPSHPSTGTLCHL
jgi:hypothetical protein